ncbi:protein RRP5 homolog [Macrobrachium nipponense]|uniref:protein RRP5 homolog n=1 Tax=Macrobrachium nipponense TaxID=159736 RepID=UPI0030C7D209
MAEKKERDLFTVKRNKSPKKSEKRKKEPDEDHSEIKKLKLSDEVPVYLEPLTYQNLPPGLVTIGCISNVTKYDLSVSLPFMIYGRVPITRISHAYTSLLKKVTESDNVVGDQDEVFSLESLFKKGQYVVTKVESVEKAEHMHKVNLCLIPQEVNFGVAASRLRKGVLLQCVVASIEDNGYAMETGISNVKVAFLNRAHAEGAGIVGVGSVVWCIITKVKTTEEGNTVHLKLSAIPNEVNEASCDVTYTDDLSLLLPGTAISTTVTMVKKHYMRLLLAESDGIVDPHHLQSPLDQLDSYEVGQKVKVRVMYITPLSRVVHLTLQSKIFTEKSNGELLHGFNIGDKKKGQVIEIQRKGIFFKIGNCCAFCLRKNLNDKVTSIEQDTLDFPIGSEHDLCVTSYHYMDKVFVVSPQKSLLEQQFVGLYGVKEGQVLKVTIKSYQPDKAIVSVGKNVDGEIPFLHLTDMAVEHPEKKYAVGSLITARVLEVVPERKRLILTCKKLLVNSKETLLTEYNKNFEGTLAKGFIVQIKSQGLLVKFFGDVKGFVPKSKASTEPEVDLFKKFCIGNVVKCKVLLVKPDEKRMTLSLLLYKENKVKTGESKENKVKTWERKENKVKTESGADVWTPKDKKSEGLLNVGAVVGCSVSKIEKDTIKVRVKPGNIRAEIPVCHLSDEKSQSKVIKSVLSPGDKIHNAVVFSKYNNIYLSTKNSVYEWIWKSKSLALEAVKESCVYLGVVSEILPSGINVSLAVDKSGQTVFINSELLRNATTLENKAEEEKNLNYTVGDSIKLKCKGFDGENKPIFSIVNMRQKKNKRYQLQSLYKYLMYQKIVQKSILKKGLASREFAETEVGNKLEVDVVHVTSQGLLVKNDDYGIYGIVLNEHLQPGQYYGKGIRVPACVLYVHMKEKCAVLTVKRDLVDQLYVHEFSKVKVGQEVSSEVLLTQKDCIIVRLKSGRKGLIAYLPPKKNVRIGQSLRVVVQHVEHKLVLCTTKVQNKLKYLPVLPSLPSFQFQVPDDICKEYKSVEEVDEKSALAKIKKIMSCTGTGQGKLRSETKVDVNEKIPEKTAIGEKSKGKNTALVKKGSKKKKTASVGDSAKDIIAIKKGLCDKGSDDSGVDENMDTDDITEASWSSKPCLKLSTGFVWNIPEIEEKGASSSDSEDEEKEELKKKKRKKLTRAEQELLAKEEEKRLFELESARLEKERLPQSALDYEELLQESPNSSAIWIQFISFHLENAEVDRARSVAQRALQVINVQEFEERINIWTVILRLEVLYGTEESLSKVFGEALATNDPLKIYIAMAMVYAENNKIKEAEDTYYKVTKKFSQTFDVWIKAGIFFFKNNMLEEGRKYMDRALLSLHKSHHVNLINRFAQLEFQFGEIERARTMFESLLSNYPKRMDMWSVYVDLLWKRGDIEGARQVLERMTSLKLRLRQMRTVFKKFLEFEKIHGTPQSVESVKTRVKEYVAASLQE